MYYRKSLSRQADGTLSLLDECIPTERDVTAFFAETPMSSAMAFDLHIYMGDIAETRHFGCSSSANPSKAIHQSCKVTMSTTTRDSTLRVKNVNSTTTSIMTTWSRCTPYSRLLIHSYLLLMQNPSSCVAIYKDDDFLVAFSQAVILWPIQDS